MVEYSSHSHKPSSPAESSDSEVDTASAWSTPETWALYRWIVRSPSIRAQTDEIAFATWRNSQKLQESSTPSSPVPHAIEHLAKELRTMVEKANPAAADAGQYATINWTEIASRQLTDLLGPLDQLQ